MAAIEKLVAGARVTATVKKGKNFEKLHGEVVKFLPNAGMALVKLESGEKERFAPEVLELRRGRRPGQVVEKAEKPAAKPVKAPVKPAKVETRKPAKANDDDEDAPKSKNEKLEEFIVKAMMKHMPLILAQILREFADALDDGETMDEDDENANSDDDDGEGANSDDDEGDGDGDDDNSDDSDDDDNSDDSEDDDGEGDDEDDDAPPPPPARKPGKPAPVSSGKRAPLILGRKR